jgi:hypothetical protein
VGFCRSKEWKIVVCQTLRMIQSSRTHTRAACAQCVIGQAAEFFFKASTLTASTYSTSLERLILLKNILPTHKTGRIFKTSFDPSNRLHLHWTYLLGVKHSYGMTVNMRLSQATTINVCISQKFFC